MKLGSMRARLTVTYAICLVILLTIVDFGIIRHAYLSRHRSGVAILEQSANDMRREIKEGFFSPKHPLELIRIEGGEMREHNISLFLATSSNHLLAPQEGYVKWPLDQSLWLSQTVKFGQYNIIVALPRLERQREINQFAISIIGLSLFIFAFTVPGAWILVGRTLRPIKQLTEHVEEASCANLRMRVHAPSDDSEIVQLVMTFNALLSRLEKNAASKSQFYAAASHEIRTPLQGLTGFLELGLARQRDAGEYRQALEEALIQSRQLNHLVEELLTLNQVEFSTLQSHSEKIDLIDITTRVLARLKNSMNAKQLTVSFKHAENCPLNAMRTHLEMLIGNLLDNAVKYSSEKTHLDVSLQEKELVVINKSSAIEDWDEEKLFEPFYRPDQSRTSATGGNGLGLAICKAICEANSWGITLHRKSGSSALDEVVTIVQFCP